MTRTSHRCVLLLALLAVAGCARGTSGFERTTLTIRGQVFEILTGHGLFGRYLENHDRFTDSVRASQELVFEPLRREMLDDGCGFRKLWPVFSGNSGRILVTA